MRSKPKVYLREKITLREIALSSAEKPSIDKEFLDKWQRIINLIAKVIHMPAAIIMQITPDTVNVLLSSEGADDRLPGAIGETLRCGLYCESEMGRYGLLIDNTDGGDEDDGPVYGPNITAHFGLPVLWPDEELFGTICVLDQKAKTLKKEYQDILLELKAAFERELSFLCYQQKLVYSAETDVLTSIFNRRKTEDVLSHEFERAKRYTGSFTVSIMDLNNFKQINDTYGHGAGDIILKHFAQGIKARIRETDGFGRWGGDEFILICPNAGSAETRRLIARIQHSVNLTLQRAAGYSDFCFGVAQFMPNDPNYHAIVKRADEDLYHNKRAYKIKSR